MSQITAQLVRELRERSGAGMMECKKALEATGGDVESAFDELRKAGLKTAEKKAGRTTAEGRVAARVGGNGRSGAMVAIACETDFVAKTPDFEGFLDGLADHVAEHRPADVEACLAQRWIGSDDRVEDALKALIGKLGENILIADLQAFDRTDGLVATYVHHDQKKGAIVSIETAADAEAAAGTLKDLCMHIVSRSSSSFPPTYLDRESIPSDDLEREKAVIREGLQGKPEEIQEKIITGRLEKFFADRVVTEQPWVKDDKLTVAKALEQALGEGTRVVGFSLFRLGA